MSRKFLLVLVMVVMAGSIGCGGAAREDAGLRAAAASPEDVETRAAALAREALLVDMHIDLPYRLMRHPEDIGGRTGGHFDLPRARQGGLDAAFMAVYTSASLTPDQAYERANQLIDLVERVAAEHPAEVALVRAPAEVRAAVGAGKIALPIGMENGAPLRTLADLDHFVGRGVRYVTLTHSANNEISDSSFAEERRWNGLSPYGRELVLAMNRLGVMVDVSHVSDEAFDQVLAISTAPVIASHSSCRAFTPGLERNLDDDRIKALAAAGGVICINFSAGFLDPVAREADSKAWREVGAALKERGLTWEHPEASAVFAAYKQANPSPRVTVAAAADHIEHVVRLVGVDHVGLGSDFDGIEHAPEGLEDVSSYPNLIAELLRRGWSEADVRKVCGENVVRIWQRIEESAH